MTNIFSPLLHRRISKETAQDMHKYLHPISLYLLATNGTLTELKMRSPFRITASTLRYHLNKLLASNLKRIEGDKFVTADDDIRECAKTLLSVVYNAIQTNKSAEIQMESAQNVDVVEEDIDGLLENYEMAEFGEEGLED